jgi:hypothetical protein
VPTARAKKRRPSARRPRRRVFVVFVVFVADDFLGARHRDARVPQRVLPQTDDQALERDGFLLRETSRRGEHENKRVHSCGFKAFKAFLFSRRTRGRCTMLRV